MKFSNGCWLQKEHVACFSPAQVYHAEMDDKRVRLLCPTARIEGRGDTLGGVNLTVEITAPMDGVLRVRTTHHAGIMPKGPSFELALPEGRPLDAEETAEKIIVRSGSLCVEIDRASAALSFFRGGERLTRSERNDLAYVKTGWS